MERTVFSADEGYISFLWINHKEENTPCACFYWQGFPTHQDWITNRCQNHWSTTLTANNQFKPAARGGRYPLWDEKKTTTEHDWTSLTVASHCLSANTCWSKWKINKLNYSAQTKLMEHLNPTSHVDGQNSWKFNKIHFFFTVHCVIRLEHNDETMVNGNQNPPDWKSK